MQRVQISLLLTIRDSEHFNEIICQLKEDLVDEDSEPVVSMVKPTRQTIYSRSEIFHSFGPSRAEKFMKWAENRKFTADEGESTYYWDKDVTMFIKENREMFPEADDDEEQAEAAEDAAIERAAEALKTE
jgi:hypothetical protein